MAAAARHRGFARTVQGARPAPGRTGRSLKSGARAQGGGVALAGVFCGISPSDRKQGPKKAGPEKRPPKRSRNEMRSPRPLAAAAGATPARRAFFSHRERLPGWPSPFKRPSGSGCYPGFRGTPPEFEGICTREGIAAHAYAGDRQLRLVHAHLARAPGGSRCDDLSAGATPPDHATPPPCGGPGFHPGSSSTARSSCAMFP